MLSLAIKAELPVVRVRTNDLLNLQEVLECLSTGKQVVQWAMGIPPNSEVVYAVKEYGEVTRATFDQLVASEKTLILVNQGEECPYAFDAGDVPVPREMMADLLGEVVPKRKVVELLPCFNGLTLKQMAEIIKLTTAQDGALTARSIVAMRSQLTGKLQGLEQVSTQMDLYLVPDRLEQWVQRNKKYFLEGTDLRLMPRGIMMAGEPGVGKTQGSKYIANEFGVPLYRLDLASALGKYVGQSEAAISRVFSALDQEDSCVLLIDEVEKLFGERDDSGVTSRLLSQFLWWAAEHKSRVLMVMTTNDVTALPKELYRAGRIDAIIEINKLGLSDAQALALQVLKQFIENPSKQHRAALMKMVKELLVKTAAKDIAHAEVVQSVFDLIKERGWK